MLIRLILFVGAVYGVWWAIDGIRVNLDSHGNAQVVSLNSIVANPAAALPRYIEVTDAQISPSYICTQDTHRAGCLDMRIPLLTAAQEADAEAGKKVTAAVIVQTDSDLTEKCNAINEGCMQGVRFRGITQTGAFKDITEDDKKLLLQSNIQLDDNVTLIQLRQAPPDSYGMNILALLGSLALGCASIFLWRKKKTVEEV